MKTTIKFALLAASISCALHGAEVAKVDCVTDAVAIKAEISANQSQVLTIVEKAVRANSSCSCEIVKAAITATNAEVELVASIVEVVAVSAPEQMRLAAQCAVAQMPEALAEVQAVLAKYDPAAGDGATVSEKGGMEKGGVAPADDSANPLDFPTDGQKVEVGPTPGGPGGLMYLPQFFPYQPPFVDTNPATNNDRN